MGAAARMSEDAAGRMDGPSGAPPPQQAKLRTGFGLWSMEIVKLFRSRNLEILVR